MKALERVKPVDEEAMAALREEDKALKDEIKAKEMIKQGNERVKEVVKYEKLQWLRLKRPRQILRRRK